MDSLNKRLSLREKADLIDGARYFDLDSQQTKGLLRSMADSYSRETLVAMSPDDFLTLAAPIGEGGGAYQDPETGRHYVASKMERVVDALEQGVPLEDIPYLQIKPADEDGYAKVRGHEGRHRAIALEKMGVRLMPVRLKSDNHRWGSGRPEDEPYDLIQEDGWEECDCSVTGRSQVRLTRTERVSTPQSLAFPSEGERKLLARLFMYASPQDRPDDYDADLVTDIVVFGMDPGPVADEPDDGDYSAEALIKEQLEQEVLKDLFRENGTSAKRDDPGLWEEVKAEVTRGSKGGRRGQWSARKAQMAVKLYKERGGGYIGPKDPDNSLTRWTEQDWRTRSGKPSLETGERYLPAAAIAELSPAEYGATTRAKRAGMKRGQQFVAQPKRIARKTAKHRKNKRRVDLVWEDFGKRSPERLVRLMVDGEQRGFLRVRRDLNMPELAQTAGCPDDLKALYHRSDGEVPVWVGWTTEIDYDLRGQGYGKALYEEALYQIAQEVMQEGGMSARFVFMPSFCGSVGTTSEAAKGVWASLVRDTPHKTQSRGLVLYLGARYESRKRRPAAQRVWETRR